MEWLRAAEPPSGVDGFWGVATMAIGAGIAPDGCASTERAKTGIEKLRGWFRAHPPDTLHERGLLVLANEAIEGLLTDDGRTELAEELFARQLRDGDWSVRSLLPGRGPTASLSIRKRAMATARPS